MEAHTYTHPHTHVETLTKKVIMQALNLCTQKHFHARSQIYTYRETFANLRPRISTQTKTHTQTHTHAHIHLYIHTHTHTHTP
jgi:hypothetical protein